MLSAVICLLYLFLGLRCTAVSRNDTSDERSLMLNRFAHLQSKASKSVLVHVHIPKAGGTALSNALSTECKCSMERKASSGSVPIPTCRDCRSVRSKDTRLPYSISRNTGWRLGVHTPYANMKYALGKPPYEISESNISAAYIIMLRSPYERFISEATHWVGKPGQAVDWSIVNDRNGTRVYYKGVQPSQLLQGNTPADIASNTRLYASLPPHFVFHNRQVKTIGGSIYDFDMLFDPTKQLGSRWRNRKGGSLNKVVERAQNVLRAVPDVLFGLQERFGEFICILEIIYGRLYRFHWDATTHSHSRKKHKVPYEGPTLQASGAEDPYADDQIYRIWARSNSADEKFYFYAERLFNVEFEVALEVLRERMKGAPQALKFAPHCRPFLNASE